MTIVLSKLRTLTVVSDTSITEPSAPYLGTDIQSPTLSMSFAESWMPETNPRILSRKISMIIAAEAPRPANRLAVDLSIRIETISMPQISAAMPCPVCLSPLIGLFCHAGRAEAIWKTAKSTALIKRNTATTI